MKRKIALRGDIDDLTHLLIENGYSDTNIVIEIQLDTQDELNRINEEFFYAQYGTEGVLPPNVTDSITVKNDSITFRYIVKK